MKQSMLKILVVMIVVPLSLMATVERDLTQDEIDSVYTNEFKPLPVGKIAVSHPPIVLDFKFEEAPQAYVDEYVKFTSISELTGYVNLGVDPSEESSSKIISFFENVSEWKNIKKKSGTKAIFADTYSMDDSGERIDDDADGVVPASGETRRINMVIKLMGLKLPIISNLTISSSDGVINITIDSVEPVKVPIVGTMMNPGGFKLNLQFVEYKNGYLAKGYTVSSLAKLEGGFEPSIVSAIIIQFFEYIKRDIVESID